MFICLGIIVWLFVSKAHYRNEIGFYLVMLIVVLSNLEASITGVSSSVPLGTITRRGNSAGFKSMMLVRWLFVIAALVANTALIYFAK